MKLVSEDPSVRSKAMKVAHMCRTLWEDNELKIVGHLASYALRHDVLSRDEVAALADVGWDLDKYQSPGGGST